MALKVRSATLGRRALMALVGSASIVCVAGTTGRAAGSIGAISPSGPGVIDPGGPPLPMTPEIRAGFALRKAADYGVAAADFDGDGRADLSVKLDGGTWKIDYSTNNLGSWDHTVPSYGGPSAIPVPADYDGDRRADLAVKDHDGGWRIDYAADGFGSWNVQLGGYGGRDARAVPADYDGDGRADLATKDGSGAWRIDHAAGGFGGWNATYLNYGGPEADPVPADYDGDGRADLAVKDDQAVWRIDYAADGFGGWNASYPDFYGGAQAHAVPADYDGDGRADLALKDDNDVWYFDYASNGFGLLDAAVSGAGGITARAVPADYDGDGRTDLGVRVDCGPWFIDHAASAFGAWNQRFDHMTASDVVTATTVSTLAWTLASDFTGTVFVPSNTTMDLSGLQELPVKSCVQIRGTRQALDPGPLLFTDYKSDAYSFFHVTGHDVRIEGVRLRGPSNGDRSQSQPKVNGIRVAVDAGLGLGGNVVVENNEAWFWTGSAVNVHGLLWQVRSLDEVPPFAPHMSYDQASLVRVTRNFLHHNSRDEEGYGVSLGNGAYATVEGNLFDHNRHAIASGGQPYTGYVARYNYVLEGGYTEEWGYWNQHFDVHGTGDGGYGGMAGERFEIAFNTFRGEQDYALGLQTRPAFMLRGIPTVGASFHDNVLVHDDRGEAVRIKDVSECLAAGPNGTFYYSDELCHLSVGPNTYDTDTTHDLGVGDFDGDGRDDLFLANGTGWWYSSAGRTEWRFLRASRLRIGSLRFGRFDDDARADVLFKSGNQWRFSPGGRGDPVLLHTDSYPLSDCVFGDFDGNGRTDALLATGSGWYLSRDARAWWTWVRNATPRASSLRVGDFDGDGLDDVFDIENGVWSWWKLGSTVADPLPVSLTTSVSSLVVGDFDGDGRDDLAQTSGTSWRYSRGAANGWDLLRGEGGQPYYKEIRSTLIGRFSADTRDDAVRYELVVDLFTGLTTGVRFVAWTGGQDAFALWSGQHVYVR